MESAHDAAPQGDQHAEGTAIERAIKLAGSEAKLAARIGCSQVAVNKAKHRNKVSGEMAVAIEKAFDGEFKRSDFRPDLFEPEEART